MKNVLIISSSPRKDGNSNMLCDRFMQGATKSGNFAKKICLTDLKINYCTGCGSCNTNVGVCVLKDDMQTIYTEMQKADVIVLATPIYFYTMCGQLKTFIDRCCPIYTQLKNKDFYYILTAADTDKAMLDRAVSELNGFVEDCLDSPTLRGVVFGVGVWHKGEILTKDAYNQAYIAGQTV